MKIAILQPEVPHYREDFFNKIKDKYGNVDLYVYNSFKSVGKNGFKQNANGLLHIGNISFKGVLAYNPIPLLFGNNDVIVLMLHQAHITTWLLLLTRFFHKKKIIVWGQGMSNKRYLKEINKPSILLKWMIKLADGAWIYMPKEMNAWKRIFPNKPMVALGNTVSGVTDMVNYKPSLTSEQLKDKYGIQQDIVFIYCARFNTPLRRIDLLEALIDKLDYQKYGFIIIGDGPTKPDFGKYPNVYDFGAVYDNDVKRELFSIADAYYQAAWMGLSVVEAMAYGCPVCTFNRSAEILQGVEVGYVNDNITGMLFDSFDECVSRLTNLSKSDFAKMGENARNMIKETATIENMAFNACSLLDSIVTD